eukprot:3039199-Rhodomonas_salina.1
MTSTSPRSPNANGSPAGRTDRSRSRSPNREGDREESPFPRCSSEQGTRRDQQEDPPPKLIPPEPPPPPPGWLPELGDYQAELDWQASVLAVRGLANCAAAARKAARFAHSHPGRRRSSVCSEGLGSYYYESDFSQADSDYYDSDCDGLCKRCGEGLYADDDDILFCREDGCISEWRRALEEEEWAPPPPSLFSGQWKMSGKAAAKEKARLLLSAPTPPSTLLPPSSAPGLLLPAPTPPPTLLPPSSAPGLLLPAPTPPSTLLPPSSASGPLLPALTPPSTLLPPSSTSSRIACIALNAFPCGGRNA